MDNLEQRDGEQPSTPDTEDYHVESFGHDCLGNITGYRVVRGRGISRTIEDQFVGDIYTPGSFDKAKKQATSLCARLNEPEPTFSQGLSWEDDGYGSPSTVVVVTAASFLGLRNAIRSQRWRQDIYSDRDCTGLEFCRSAQILHVGKTSAGHSAVLLVTRHFDV